MHHKHKTDVPLASNLSFFKLFLFLSLGPASLGVICFQHNVQVIENDAHMMFWFSFLIQEIREVILP